ncbi:hypothetical protein Tco_1063880, partial [Tanacetum coccineum]
MDLNKQDMNMNENQLNNSMEVVENIDMNKQVFEKDNELESDTEDVLHEFANPNVVIEEVTESLVLPIESLMILDKSHEIHDKSHLTESLVIQPESFVILDESHEIHDKSHEPNVEGIPIPVEGTWYDTVDEAIDMYLKYAKMRDFEV